MMSAIVNRRVAFAVVLLVLLVMVALAGGGGDEQTTQQSSGMLQLTVYPVSDLFSHYYADMGGLDTLGPCISEQFDRHGLTFQLTQNGLMAYDPGKVAANRFYLSRVGTLFGLGDLPEGGYEIWEEVRPIYEATGGDIGAALTDVLRNDEKQCYEQYCEGAGFYRLFTEPPGTIHWMEYGVWVSDGKVPDVKETGHGQPTPQVTPGPGEITQVLVNYAERWDKIVTGNVLEAEARLIEDGWYELVYENVVFAVHPQNLGNVILRPLPKLLGLVTEPGVICTGLEGHQCVPVEDNLVHMVPDVFINFLIQYGVKELAGQPTTVVHHVENRTSYQCFEALCMLCDENAPEGQRVTVMPLGIDYILRYATPITTPIATPDVPVNGLLIHTWPANALIPNGEAQKIYVQVIEGARPVEDALFSLSLTYPDGRGFAQNFPLTDVTGQSVLTLEPINAPEGTIVPYMICYLGLQERPACTGGLFTIWSSNP